MIAVPRLAQIALLDRVEKEKPARQHDAEQ